MNSETYPDEQPGSFESRYPDLVRDGYLTVEGYPIQAVILNNSPQKPMFVNPTRPTHAIE